MAVRGCGRRVAGGTYLVCETSPIGLPLEHFIFCPPHKVPEIGLSAQGQVLRTIRTANGPATLMFDHVGEKFYPNVTDYLEEGRRMGFSWHASPQVAAQLTPLSWAMPVHPRAFILNWRELAGRPIDSCPRLTDRHVVGEGEIDADMAWYLEEFPEPQEPYGDKMCSGYWWCDVKDAERLSFDPDSGLAEVRREMPSFWYTAHLLAGGIVRRYERGVIAKLPINGIEVIAGGAETQASYNRLSEAHEKTGLPVRVVTE